MCALGLIVTYREASRSVKMNDSNKIARPLYVSPAVSEKGHQEHRLIQISIDRAIVGLVGHHFLIFKLKYFTSLLSYDRQGKEIFVRGVILLRNIFLRWDSKGECFYSVKVCASQN